MATTDPLPAGWDAGVIRKAVRFAMIMGAPESVADRATFHFEPVVTYPVGTKLDRSGKPFDPTVQPTVTEPAPVQVPCAVEYLPGSVRNPDEIAIGTVREVAATVTVLDEDYTSVADATTVILGQDQYRISYAQLFGLFDITVHQFNCFAVSED